LKKTLFGQQIKQICFGKSTLAENAEKGAFGKFIVERNNGFTISILKTHVAAFLANGGKTCFL